MDTIKLKDLTFKPYISKEEIATAVKNVAARINKDLADKNPLFLCVLNGAFVFAADLFREINHKLGVTIVIVTHDISLADRVDRVVMISDGKISSERVLREEYKKKIEAGEMTGTVMTDMIKEGKITMDVLYNALKGVADVTEGIDATYETENKCFRVDTVPIRLANINDAWYMYR